MSSEALIRMPEGDEYVCHVAPNDIIGPLEDGTITYKYTVLHEGHLLPVSNMFDALGCAVSNPMHAFTCVAFQRPDQWLALHVQPGEIS